jgi:hypothetical protein
LRSPSSLEGGDFVLGDGLCVKRRGDERALRIQAGDGGQILGIANAAGGKYGTATGHV